MKTVILTIALIILVAGTSSAQTGLGFNLYAGGGGDVPLDDLKTYWKTGFHGTIGLGRSLSPGIEIVARYAYHTFPTEGLSDTVQLFGNSEADLDLHEYGIDFRANLAAPGLKFRPYGLIGLGFVKIPSANKFFYCVGGGFKVAAMPKLNFFLEARYTRITLDDFEVGYVPITIGLNLSL